MHQPSLANSRSNRRACQGDTGHPPLLTPQHEEETTQQANKRTNTHGALGVSLFLVRCLVFLRAGQVTQAQFIIAAPQVAFERQRMEIANLHVAEEKAELRTDRIRKELGSSEKELSALEREMNEIGA